MPYVDDPTIAADWVLWRRVPPASVVPDAQLGRMRPTSAACDDGPDGDPMSVLLANELHRPADALVGHDGFYLVAITAELVRQCGFAVCRDPLPEQPAHALVVGKKTRAKKKRLARECTWVDPPPADERIGATGG